MRSRQISVKPRLWVQKPKIEEKLQRARHLTHCARPHPEPARMGCLCSKGAYPTTYEDVAGSKKIALESPGRLGCRFAGIKFAHDGVENSKRHRGSGKLVLVDDALHFWLRCTDVYFAIELKDCVKVELRDSWGGVRIQRTGKEKERTAIVVVTFKSRGGKTLNQAGFVVLPDQKQAWLTKTRQAALDAGGFSIVEGRARPRA